MSLLVIVPSRNRPQSIKRLLQAWQDTGAVADLLVAVDNDDHALAEYKKLDCNLVVGPRLRLGPTLNAVAVAEAGKYGAVGFMGDDHLPVTKNWDVAVERALEASMMVYGNDLLQGANLPTAVFMWSHIVKRIGYMVPPGMVHLYLDNFWLALGQSLNSIQYLPSVIIEHLHPSAGKADSDAGYEEVNAPSLYDHDGGLFHNYVATQLAADVEKILG